MTKTEMPWRGEEEEAYQMLAQWFRRHADDPARVCPPNAQDGGYHWIYGGPYRAEALLVTTWGTIFTAAFLARVGTRIAAATGCDVWSGQVDLLTLIDWGKTQGWDVDALFAPREPQEHGEDLEETRHHG